MNRQEIASLDPDLKTGLSAQQAAQRLEGGWSNRVSVRAGRTEKEIITQNIFTFFNLVFVILALVLVIFQSSVKNMTFLIVVIINTAIGIFQEIRAKRALDKLTLVAAQQLPVLRDGQLLPVRSDLLVRDDLVQFRAGDQVCADARLRSGSLLVNEALLTGESDLIEKKPGDSLHSGSFCVSGSGLAQLTRVGDDAYAAQLTAQAKADPRVAKSEMMRSLDKLVRVMGVILIPVGLLLYYDHFKVMAMDATTSAEKVVAALVGMIPEGLYLLTSVALALSSLKLTQQRVLVQDMNCIESLARVDVLCVDKTGTITEPEMEVSQVVPLTRHPHTYIESILTALYGTREPDNETARAIRELFFGRSDWHCTRYYPFQSQRKWCAGEFEGQGAFFVGAPEVLMGSRYGSIQEAVEEAAQSSRVLLLARCDGPVDPQALQWQSMEPLALLLVNNRLRRQAEQTFSYFRQQDVKIKVISGDSPVTASRVAMRAGIEGAENWVDAQDLETPEKLLQAAEHCTVFGRVTPERKRQLIQALKKLGHTVAMTGDGVNDVLAMKESDCGVAMASGAQAASHVARLVLLDSDFTAMPAIVGEGRRVINNIQRAAALFLVKNIFSLSLALLCLVTPWAYPFQPIQLTLISVLTIGVPAFFLALEPNYERVRGRFLPNVLRRALPGGLANVIVVTLCQLIMDSFSLPVQDLGTVCTAVLATVGLLVLFLESRPFTKIRLAVLSAMTVGMVGAFLVLPGLFELAITEPKSYLVLLCGVIMAPTVFFALQWVFRLADRLLEKWRKQ